jgi:serine/threonine-protein kinase RsbW
VKTALPGARGKLVPAAPEAVDRLCAELRTSLLPRLPESERFVVELLVREALMNAVAHGSGNACSRNDSSRQARPGAIRYEIRPLPGGIVIRVNDGGRGFDWHGWRDDDISPLAESGRGLKIIHRYSDRVRFFGNGSRVELVRIFPERELQL